LQDAGHEKNCIPPDTGWWIVVGGLWILVGNVVVNPNQPPTTIH
jgi:hypothetical protein